MPETEVTQGTPDPLIAHLGALRKRVKKEDWSDPQHAVTRIQSILCDEIIPTHIAEIERVIEVDELVDEMMDQTENYLHEDQAAQIIGTLGLGAQIMQEISKHITALDDFAQKRLRNLITAYEKSAEHSAMIVAEAAADPDEDEDGDDDKTPVEIPPKGPSAESSEDETVDTDADIDTDTDAKKGDDDASE